MKKQINKLKNYHPCKPLAILYLLIPIIISFFTLRIIDNDFWFLINTGRYIVHSGFPTIEPFTIHHNLAFVVQQWLTDVIFYLVYNRFSQIGIFILLFLLNIVIVYLIYKICLLVSENRLGLSIIITDLIMFILDLCYIRTRPQVFDFIILLLEIYTLESYIRKKNNKYLIVLPFLSLLLINFHASSWFMLLLFMLPYLIDSTKLKVGDLKCEGYGNKYLFLILIPIIIMGMINPYGIKSISYIFTSFGDKYINMIVSEMHPIYHVIVPYFIFFIIIIIIIIITNIINFRKIKIRYLCLQIGTIILGIQSVKGFSFLLIGGVFPVVYYLKDKFKVYKEEYTYSRKFKISYIFIFSIIILIPLIISLRIDKEVFETNNIIEITNYLNNTIIDKENAILYTDYDTGSYLEWNGYKVYLDPRAEIFLKSNNKKENILYEYYNLEHNKLDFTKFLDKYSFNYLIVNNKSPLFSYLKKSEHYEIVYEEKVNGSKNNYYYLVKKIK